MSDNHHTNENPSSRPIWENSERRGTPQDVLNLRPLPNRLGYNGPYIGGGMTETPERDCARIEGHTHLFRDLSSFEQDLREAIELVWDEITAVRIASQRVADDRADAEAVVFRASDALTVAFRYMQEAYLVAEVLNDREKRRIKEQAKTDFLALIPDTPREDMSGMDMLAEEGRLTWQISALLDRMSYSRGAKVAWPKPDTERLLQLTERLEQALQPPSGEDLQTMSDADLNVELLDLEHRIGQTRRTIAMIHAVRLLRKSSATNKKGA